MKLLLRLAAWGAVWCALLGAAVLLWGWAPPGGPFDDLRRLGDGARLDGDLGSAAGRVARRIEEREAVTAALIGGHLSLGEATERFRAINEADPEAGEAARKSYPSASEGEVARLQVLAWARARMAGGRPTVRREVMERLDRESQSPHPGQ